MSAQSTGRILVAPIQGRRAPNVRAWLWPLLTLALTAGLLYFALRDVDWSRLWTMLDGLRWWQIGLVLLIDAAIYWLFTARWWIVAKAFHSGIRFGPLLAIRLSAFGLSYFTLGPQVGGEPLQVAYLHRRERVLMAHATASVLMDKLLEILANYVLLLVATFAMFRAGFIFTENSGSLVVAAPLLIGLWPLVHVVLLRHGILPVSTVARMLPAIGPMEKIRRFVKVSELVAARFCQRRPQRFAFAAGVSLLATLLAVLEYGLIGSVVGGGLNVWQSVAGWGAAWLSFLAPLPGGAGSLEAGQVLILGRLGVSAETALAMALLMRARDVIFGGIGMLLGTAHISDGGRG